ncbi:alpha/beta hydrolase [Anaeromicrobium sediminis]|uniref:Alpha/beta hydrolase n=1 Tax=Anaeromicrobium sediminis TaxID=1478221 RepID=A0A267MKH0_9FIRM|nr:alpha/beta hydrolase [Anaeromicrobium sediminis]PAB59293.1 alpha/beta hydrolase [Anaeromicrobium sediminis]
MLTKYVADMMIKPGASPVFDKPSDFGLDHEDVTFKAKDGVELSGWLIKGGSERVIIQSHFGVQSSRSGYTPVGKGMIKMWKEDIHFLNQAKHLVDQGYSVLMYDFRNHGDSGISERPWVSWGPEEAKDVAAAVNYISTHPVYTNAKIGLLSICMGAASTTYAFGNGLIEQGKISAMVAVQPLIYPDFVKAMGIPNFIAKRVNVETTKRLGFDLNQKSFLPDVNKIDMPTMVIQNTNDPWANKQFVENYFEALNTEKEMLWVDLEKSRAASYDYIGKQPETLSKFFDKYMK